MSALENFQTLFLAQLKAGDYVGFTFFIGSMAMLASTVFFFVQMTRVEPKWKDSMLVSGLITGIAAVHYFYMRGFWAEFQMSPTEFRYIDWTLTVPLMCVEFYLILKKQGAQIGLLWKLIAASVAMLVLGYIGEAIYPEQTVSWVWGALSGAAYFYIVYLIWFGEVAQLAANAGGAIQRANKTLAWFVLVGWAIYPIGYILGTKGGLFGIAFTDIVVGPMDVIYNIGDAVNKIGFGLVIYSLAIASMAEKEIELA